MVKRWIFLVWMTCMNGVLIAQAPSTLTLEDVIHMAVTRSSSSLQAQNLKENKYWDWKAHQSNYKPQLSLSGALPDFTRSFIPVSQPDGNIIFQPVNYNNSSLDLSLSQTIGLTGGEIFVNSSMQRFDDFENDFTQFSGTPFSVGLMQPLFAYNELSWNNKIEPLKFEQSLRSFPADLELISYQATELFFNLQLAQTQLEIAQSNLSNTDTLLHISQVRFDLGRISEETLLQLQLSKINSSKAVSAARVAHDIAALQLRSYLNFRDTIAIRLELPAHIPGFDVNPGEAIAQALQNSPREIGFRIRKLEAQRELAEAKGTNGLSANLFASFGVANAASNAESIYSDTQQSQTLRIGFSVPILDWGRSASRVKSAKANQALTDNVVEQEMVDFEQEIFALVSRFRMLRDQIKDTRDADRIAQKRYEISKERYIIGNYSLTELNIAQSEKDTARLDYLFSLRDFWLAYYELRAITLFDYTTGRTLMIN